MVLSGGDTTEIEENDGKCSWERWYFCIIETRGDIQTKLHLSLSFSPKDYKLLSSNFAKGESSSKSGGSHS